MSVTPQIDWLEPRSTSSHCGSENALDHRVPVLPSVALAAGNDAFSSDEAVVGRPSARLVVPQVLLVVPNTLNSHRLYPNWVALVVPNMRMYRPDPDTLSVWTPP